MLYAKHQMSHGCTGPLVSKLTPTGPSVCPPLLIVPTLCVGMLLTTLRVVWWQE